jgi:transcriptional regulator GlxA family with amidase domain/YHS domain-containing protein
LKRRELLHRSAAFGLIAAVPAFGTFSESSGPAEPNITDQAARSKLNALKPPAEGTIPVAFVISHGAVVIDFAGPWEVFGNVMIGGRMDWFRLYTVAEKLDPIRASGGMKIVPDYTLETAPAAKVVVVPAQNEPSEAVLDWIRKASRTADVTMSVCTGAYLLAQTGLLAGKAATTHHASYVDLATKFPDIRVKRGVRFVEDGNLASSGGLSCGIDLAFRVVERYFGHDVAEQAAYDMEYQGRGWMNPDSNAVYTRVRTSANNHPLCAVCGMDVDPIKGPKSFYKNKTYYFCSQDHKDQFDGAPAKFVGTSKQ